MDKVKIPVHLIFTNGINQCISESVIGPGLLLAYACPTVITATVIDYQYITPNAERQRFPPLTFSASCSNSRSWKHWSSWSLRTCQAWWRCCRVECSLSSSWVIRGSRPWVSTLQTPPLPPLPPPLPPPPLPPRLEKDSLL